MLAGKQVGHRLPSHRGWNEGQSCAVWGVLLSFGLVFFIAGASKRLWLLESFVYACDRPKPDRLGPYIV